MARRTDGSSPYADWFNTLDAQAAAKVVTAKLRMELGNTSNVKWYSGIGEYVIDWGRGYRIYLAKDGDALIMLFGGGTKRRQQAHIARAKRCMRSTRRGKPQPARTISPSDRGGESDVTDA
jgi:putative addiction module killer protein